MNQYIKTLIIATRFVSVFLPMASYAAAELENKNDESLTELVQKTFYYNYPAEKINIESCKQLLAANADPNVTNDQGDPLLNLAIRNHRSALLIKLLLAHKANTNTKNSWKEQPLIQAIEADASIDIIHLLLNNGADSHAEPIVNYLKKTAERPLFFGCPNHDAPHYDYVTSGSNSQTCLAQHVIDKNKKKLHDLVPEADK